MYFLPIRKYAYTFIMHSEQILYHCSPHREQSNSPCRKQKRGHVCLNTSVVSAVIKPASSWKIIKGRQGKKSKPQGHSLSSVIFLHWNPSHTNLGRNCTLVYKKAGPKPKSVALGRNQHLARATSPSRTCHYARQTRTHSGRGPILTQCFILPWVFKGNCRNPQPVQCNNLSTSLWTLKITHGFV